MFRLYSVLIQTATCIGVATGRHGGGPLFWLEPVVRLAQNRRENVGGVVCHDQ